MARLTLFAMLAMSVRAQPDPGMAPVASLPVVEVSGTISAVQLARGQGMPYLDVKEPGKTMRLYLGAMHYLIAQNFNPKSGQAVRAKGYKLDDAVIGIEVTLADGRPLRLRDAQGRPLWRGGRWSRSGSQ